MTALMDNLSAGVLVFRSGVSVLECNKVGQELMDFAGDEPNHWQWLDEAEQPLGVLDRPIQPGATPRASVSDRLMGLRSLDGQRLRWVLCNTYRQMGDPDGDEPLTVLTRFGIRSARRWYWFTTSLHAALVASSLVWNSL